MINFRYHVVSIVAVFLALAVGIVIGSTELRGTSFDLLRKSASDLNHDLKTKRAQNKALQSQVSADEAFAQTAVPWLLPGRLDGQRVVFLAAPGAPQSVVRGISLALKQAGATVTGQLALLPRLFDASADNQQFLSELVQTLVSSGDQPRQGTPLQEAAQLLGSAILTKDDPSATAAGKQSAAVLSSYERASLVSVASGQPGIQATLAVVVVPATPPTGSKTDTQGLVTLAQEMSTAGAGTVMVSSISGAAAGSAILALRGNGSAAAHVSSVDDADTEIGQIVSVWALEQELTGHKSGSYGFAAGRTGAAPSPAPSPSPSPTGSPSSSGRAGASSTKSPRSHG